MVMSTKRSTMMPIELCFRSNDERISCNNRCQVAVFLINLDHRYSCTVKLKLNFPNDSPGTLILRSEGILFQQITETFRCILYRL